MLGSIGSIEIYLFLAVIIAMVIAAVRQHRNRKQRKQHTPRSIITRYGVAHNPEKYPYGPPRHFNHRGFRA